MVSYFAALPGHVRLTCFALGFDEGSPDGYDPLQIAREMASQGITLVRLEISFVVMACRLTSNFSCSFLSPASLLSPATQ